MMRCDAEWLGHTLASLSAEELSPVLNLGASTRHFREVEQPYIHERVFRPLEARGIRVIHSDLKAAEGVDIVGDVFNDTDFAELKATAPRAVICTHMFEHVRDRRGAVTPTAGSTSQPWIVLCHRAFELPRAQRSYRHDVPPHSGRAGGAVRGARDSAQGRTVGDTYWSHVARRPLTIFLRHFLRFFVPFLGWHAWKRSMRKLYWLFNPYKVAAVVGRKVG